MRCMNLCPWHEASMCTADVKRLGYYVNRTMLVGDQVGGGGGGHRP